MQEHTYEVPINSDGSTPLWMSHVDDKFYYELGHRLHDDETAMKEIILRQVEPPFHFDGAFFCKDLFEYGFLALIEG